MGKKIESLNLNGSIEIKNMFIFQNLEEMI